MHGRHTSLLLVVALIVAGCSPEIPDWFEDPPEDPNWIFASTVATSAQQQTAVDKAQASARGDIAEQLRAKYEGVARQFVEEIGMSEDSQMYNQFVEASQTTVSETLVGTVPKEREIQREDGQYRAYVLMAMPIGQASNNLMSKLQQREEVYARFRATEAYDLLEEEVEELEEERRAPMNHEDQEGSRAQADTTDG